MQSGKIKLYGDFSLINEETSSLDSEWVVGSVGMWVWAKWICTGTWLRFFPSQAQLKQQQCSWTLVPSFQPPTSPKSLSANKTLLWNISFVFSGKTLHHSSAGWLGCWPEYNILFISLWHSSRADSWAGWLPVFVYSYGKGNLQIRMKMMKATFFKSNFFIFELSQRNRKLKIAQLSCDNFPSWPSFVLLQNFPWVTQLVE